MKIIPVESYLDIVCIYNVDFGVKHLQKPHLRFYINKTGQIRLFKAVNVLYEYELNRFRVKNLSYIKIQPIYAKIGSYLWPTL